MLDAETLGWALIQKQLSAFGSLLANRNLGTGELAGGTLPPFCLCDIFTGQWHIHFSRAWY